MREGIKKRKKIRNVCRQGVGSHFKVKCKSLSLIQSVYATISKKKTPQRAFIYIHYTQYIYINICKTGAPDYISTSQQDIRTEMTDEQQAGGAAR